MALKTRSTSKKWQVRDRLICTDEPNYQTIAYLSDEGNRKSRSTAQTEADARLIANAPVLLRSLADLLERLNNTSPMDWQDYCSSSDMKIAEIETADRAIAPATGVDR